MLVSSGRHFCVIVTKYRRIALIKSTVLFIATIMKFIVLHEIFNIKYKFLGIATKIVG